MNITARQILNIIALAIVIPMNFVPVTGVSTAELSDRYSVVIIPASYAFSIWGLIYLSLIGFVIYQALPAQRSNSRLRSADPFVLLNFAANVGWNITWQYQILWLNIPMMFMQLVSLMFILVRLDLGNTQVSRTEFWFARFPFSVYAGWITVAAIANTGTLLYSLNWDGWGFSAGVWGAIMLVIGAGIGLVVGTRFASPVYKLVIVWAYIGIAVAHSNVAPVATVAIMMALTVALVALINTIRNRPRQPRLAT